MAKAYGDFRKKSKANVGINLNLLGEAVLGEEEAEEQGGE